MTQADLETRIDQIETEYLDSMDAINSKIEEQIKDIALAHTHHVMTVIKCMRTIIALETEISQLKAVRARKTAEAIDMFDHTSPEPL